MKTRCSNNENLLKDNPTYRDCTCCEEWEDSFMAFHAWLSPQYFEGCNVDKDLLYPGNKYYSPQTCVVVSQAVNKFLTDSGASRGELPIGVSRHRNRYVAKIGDNGDREYLGLYDCPSRAHLRWLERKIELAFELAETQSSLVAMGLGEHIVEWYFNSIEHERIAYPSTDYKAFAEAIVKSMQKYC